MSGNPPIVFPANPTVGQLFTANNTTWVWNGTAWVNANTSTNFLPLTGGSLAAPGNLSVSGTLNAAGAATFGTLSASGTTTLAGTNVSTLTASGVVNPQGGIQGVTTAAAAAAGLVGQIVTLTAGPTAVPINAVGATLGTVTVPAGDWDFTAQFQTNISGGNLQWANGNVITGTINFTASYAFATGNNMAFQVAGFVQSAGAATLTVTGAAVMSAGSMTMVANLYLRRRR